MDGPRKRWRTVWATIQADREGLIVLGAIIAVLGVFRWAVFSPNVAPPGSDGGQWLAFGHQMFAGERIKAGFESYPPIVPGLVSMFAAVFPPMMALKLVGGLVSVVLAVPLYGLVRQVTTPVPSAIVAGVVGIAPYHTEVLTFGGYPQLAGAVFMLLALWLLLLGLKTGGRLYLLAAGLASAGAAATHVLVSIELAVAGLALCAVFVWSRRSGSLRDAARLLRPVAVWTVLPAVLIAAPVLPTYLNYVFDARRTPANPLNLSAGQVSEWLRSAWRWELVLWAVVGLVSVPVAAFEFGVRRAPVAGVALTLLAIAFVGVAFVRELRFLQVFELGMVLSAGVTVAAARSQAAGATYASLAKAAAAIALLLVMVAVMVVGVRRSLIAYRWYAVVTNPVLDAMEWLRRDAAEAPAGIIVASGAPRGHNYGWWLEGYVHRPAYMAGDPFLFFDARERQQVEIAARLLDPMTPISVARSIVQSENIQFAFIDKGIDGQTPLSLRRLGFAAGFENGHIVVLKRATGE
ncbi:MAG: hypothetical protein HYY34_07670 [Chloroflexi bacterium]|nr:hypothetical protein [Chloroflexota bacterium]